jgi:hypothetical protein
MAGGGGTPRCEQPDDHRVICTPTPGHGLDNFIRRVDDPAQHRRERQKRGEALPGVLEGGDGVGVLAAQFGGLKRLQLDPCRLGISGLVDRFQRRGNSFAVAPVDEPHRGPDQMHHTGLDRGVRPGGLDGFGEAGEAVAAHDQHVFDAAVGQLGAHPSPKPGALSCLHPNAQHMLDAVHVHPDSDMGGLVAHMRGVFDLDHQRIQIDHRIQRAGSSERCESLWRSLADPSLHGLLWCPVIKAEAWSVVQLGGDAVELLGGPRVEVGPLGQVLP